MRCAFTFSLFSFDAAIGIITLHIFRFSFSWILHMPLPILHTALSTLHSSLTTLHSRVLSLVQEHRAESRRWDVSVTFVAAPTRATTVYVA